MLRITPDILYLINLVMLTFTIFIAIIFYMKRKNRIPVEVLYPDKTYKEERWKKQMISGESKLSYGSRKKPEHLVFSPNDFFTEVKPWYKFFRLPKRKLYVNKAGNETIQFKKSETNKNVKLDKLQYLWSKKEIQDWIEKQIAREKAKAKVIDNKMFILLMVMVMMSIFVNLLVARKLDVF